MGRTDTYVGYTPAARPVGSEGVEGAHGDTPRLSLTVKQMMPCQNAPCSGNKRFILADHPRTVNIAPLTCREYMI